MPSSTILHSMMNLAYRIEMLSCDECCCSCKAYRVCVANTTRICGLLSSTTEAILGLSLTGGWSVTQCLAHMSQTNTQLTHNTMSYITNTEQSQASL